MSPMPGEPLFWDVLENTRGPVIATHSDAKALCSHPRNLTDQQFLALKQRARAGRSEFFTRPFLQIRERRRRWTFCVTPSIS